MERFNASMKGMLRKVLPDWDGQWDKALPHILGEYRRAPNETMGFTPSELLHGRQIRGPLQTLRERWVACESTSENVISYVLKLQEHMEAIQEAARKNESEQKKKYKRWYDQKARECSFKAGELVLLRTPPKQHGLNAVWEGPYAVVKKHSDLVYELYMPEHPRRRGKYHVNLLEPYNSPTAECLLVDGVDTDIMDPPSDKRSESISQLFLNPVLTSDQKTKLNKLLHYFGDIFTDKPGRTKATEIRIEMEDVYPIHFPPYRLPMAKFPQLEAEVKQLLQAGVIRPSSSPWASPIVLVPKSDGSTRLCVDYRRLNKVTKSDPFPMPRVDELIDRLGNANCWAPSNCFE